MENLQRILDKIKEYGGNNDELSTTLQAVATAQMFQKANLPAYIMISGGTNTKTTLLAKQCGIKANCLAVGSYARKIVSEYLKIENLLENKEALKKAVKIAKSLIDISLENHKFWHLINNFRIS